MFKGKTIVIGITGGIAAYKMPNLVSMLVKNGADVYVILTENAQKIVSPIPFESLTKHKCITDTFDRNFTMDVNHVSLGKKADAFLIAPATANIIGKLSHGIADDMLSTTALTFKCPMLISPAMNSAMYENPIVRDNIETLKKYGYTVIDAKSGHLACGDDGIGKMPEPQELFEHLKIALTKKDLCGLKVLVTAGPTRQPLDPVRFISNYSSGKMGYALAKAAMERGAKVTLVSGPVNIEPPLFVNTINITTAKEMFDKTVKVAEDADIIIKAAAVADYTPKTVAENKIKKSDSCLSVEFSKTDDILSYLGKNKKDGQFICGFSMETENMLENSEKKLISKNIDMIAANNLNEKGAGFAGDTNILTVITKDRNTPLPVMSKELAAHHILDEILKHR